MNWNGIACGIQGSFKSFNILGNTWNIPVVSSRNLFPRDAAGDQMLYVGSLIRAQIGRNGNFFKSFGNPLWAQRLGAWS